ncbi:MAG: hypothetical protein AAFP76_08410 [Bacteroidota bacterium]
MNKIQRLLIRIAQLNTDIQVNYPELYRNLDENPMTIPTMDHPRINLESLQEYLESLQELVRRHTEIHKGTQK